MAPDDRQADGSQRASRSGGSSTRPASGWRRGDGGDSLAPLPVASETGSGFWRAWPAATSLDRDQGRSRRPGRADSRLLPFRGLAGRIDLDTGAVASNRLAGRPHVARLRPVGFAAGSISPERHGGSGRLHREMDEARDLRCGGLPPLAWVRWPGAGGRVDLP